MLTLTLIYSVLIKIEQQLQNPLWLYLRNQLLKTGFFKTCFLILAKPQSKLVNFWQFCTVVAEQFKLLLKGEIFNGLIKKTLVNIYCTCNQCFKQTFLSIIHENVIKNLGPWTESSRLYNCNEIQSILYIIISDMIQ